MTFPVLLAPLNRPVIVSAAGNSPLSHQLVELAELIPTDDLATVFEGLALEGERSGPKP
jgi:hypothetical protein